MIGMQTHALAAQVALVSIQRHRIAAVVDRHDEATRVLVHIRQVLLGCPLAIHIVNFASRRVVVLPEVEIVKEIFAGPFLADGKVTSSSRSHSQS